MNENMRTNIMFVLSILFLITSIFVLAILLDIRQQQKIRESIIFNRDTINLSYPFHEWIPYCDREENKDKQECHIYDDDLVLYYNLDNKSTLGWDSPNDLPNKFVGLNEPCRNKGDIIYSYKEDYDNFYVTSCSSNGKRIIVVFPKEYINPSWDFEVYYPINITINTSPRRDISYFQDNLTKVIYPVVDGIAELGVHNVYETIVLVDVSDEMYVVSRLFCKDGVIKLGDTDDSNIKSVECKEQLQKEIGGMK